MSELQMIHTKVDRMLNMAALERRKAKKETWVGVAVVKYLTGWEGKEVLRMMRKNGCIIFDSNKGYLLESIPDKLLIKREQTLEKQTTN